MDAEELARTLGARGRGPKWRARCPVHKGKSLTLAIFSDKDQPRVHCFAGCLSDDVLAAVGLTWKDLAPQKEWLSPVAYREQQRIKQEEEMAAYRLRIREWIKLFQAEGYTMQKYETDLTAATAASMMLAAGHDKGDATGILRVSMERIAAASIIGLPEGLVKA